jgi:hypothetical protein
MQKSLRLLGAIALIGLAVWGWRFLFPTPEQVITARLHKLARIVSFKSSDGILKKAFALNQAPSFCAPDFEVQIEPRAAAPILVKGRDEIIQYLSAVMNRARSLKVEFLDIHVKVSADHQTATANLTGKWTIDDQRDFDVSEMNFLLRQQEGVWIIYRVETVKTLSLNRRPRG